MKYLFVILLTSSLFTAFSQPPGDTTNLIRKYHIAVATISTVVLQKGIINSERSTNTVTFYDESGRPTEDRIRNLDEKKTIVYKFEYGPCREYNRWEWLEYHDDRMDTIQIQTVSFDGHCRMEKIVWKDSTDSITDVRNLYYNNAGRQTKEIDRNAKGEMTSFVLYSYPDSLTIDKKGFFADSSFWYHNREHVDAKGNTLSTTSIEENGNETVEQEGKTENHYKEGKITETVSLDSEGNTIAITTWSYNSEGMPERTVSKSVSKDEDSESITTYRYIKR